ncbi:MAG: HAD-IA family hydrolase [Pseudomonadota bacterium]
MAETLIIFDCDGTLVDSQHLIVAAMSDAFALVDRPAPPRDAILSIVGLSLPYAVAMLMPGASAREVDAVSEGYKAAFGRLRAQPESAEPLYPGIEALVRDLAARANVLLGIATGKSRRGVDRVLAHHALEGLFATIHTADEHISKPDPDMILSAMELLDVPPERTVMIGDTTFDVEMARAAGAQAIGVAWGYHEVADLERSGAHTIVATAASLAEHLEPIIAVGQSIDRRGRV